MQEYKSRLRVWWQALRYHFVPPSIFPATLGAVVSWAVDRTFFPWYFALVLLGVIFNHVGLNMMDDYFDYKHSVDILKDGEKNPYTGGSGTLSQGLIKPSHMLVASLTCFFTTVVIGMYLAYMRGITVLLFGLFGGLCAVFYTAPPVSLSHRGLGELALLVNFGTTIGLGSYYVQAQRLSTQAFLATLPLGIMLFSMIVINEIPDIEQDRLAGKLTLIVRYGAENGIKFYVASWILTYIIILGGVALGILPWLSLIALLSLPLVYKSIQILRANYSSPTLLAPANLYMIKAHSITSIGLIAAYSIYGVLSGAELSSLAILLSLLTVSYLPSILILRLNKKEKKE
jgi:1,4-dihydroxy-2-naphthoate polyprenyltransferase